MDLTDIDISAVIKRVNTWASVHARDMYMYSSRMTYFGNAFDVGIITKNEYDAARIYFGNLWDYVGD